MCSFCDDRAVIRMGAQRMDVPAGDGCLFCASCWDELWASFRNEVA